MAPLLGFFSFLRTFEDQLTNGASFSKKKKKKKKWSLATKCDVISFMLWHRITILVEPSFL